MLHLFQGNNSFSTLETLPHGALTRARLGGKAQVNPRAPEVLFFQDELSSADMLRLYGTASVT